MPFSKSLTLLLFLSVVLAAAAFGQEQDDDYLYPRPSAMVHTVYFYEKNNIEKRMFYYPQGKLAQIDRLTLDKNGNVIELLQIVNLQNENSKSFENRVSYKYLESDAHGNWTLRQMISPVTLPDGSKKDSVAFQKRTITYHQTVIPPRRRPFAEYTYVCL